MTKSLRDEFKKLNYTISYIPSGCTGFVQVLNVGLNKELKALIAQKASNYANKYYNRYKASDFTVADRRVLLTYQVVKAQAELYKKYKHVIIKTFKFIRLSLNPNSFKDTELKVKGLLDIAIKDYTRKELKEKNSLRSLIAPNIVAIKSAQAKLAIRAIKAKAKKAA